MADLTEDLSTRFLGAQRRVYRAMDTARWPVWAGLELTMAQMKVLARICGDAPQHLGEVAGGLGISLSTASHLVDRLVRQGLLERREDPEDRRRLRLARTERGEDLVDLLRRAGTDRLRGWLARLGPADLQALVRGMEALAAVAESGGTADGCGDRDRGAGEAVR